MILQQLYQDADDILKENPPPPMYDTKFVRWRVVLTDDGRLLDFQSMGGAKDTKRGIPHLLPHPGPRAGNVIRPALLADTVAYALGLAPEDARVQIKHSAFKAQAKACAEKTGDAVVTAIAHFLATWDTQKSPVLIPEQMTASDLVTFQVGDCLWPIDKDAVRSHWAHIARASVDEGNADEFQCLISGRRGPAELSLPMLVKGVPGGQSSGIALISANEKAFESYGLERAQTSPVIRAAAERFTKSLNHLITGANTHITVGGLVYVFWKKSGEDEEFFELISEAETDQVKKLISSYESHTPFTEFDDEKFHVFALSASGGRAVIRDTLSTTVGDARANLARWFDAQRIVTPSGQEEKYFSLYRLAACAYRDPSKDMLPQTPRQLLGAALHGSPIPALLRDKVVLRCRVTHKQEKVTHAQAALIKAVFMTNSDGHFQKEGWNMTKLDENQSNSAYRCGRLLAELEVIQRTALHDTNTTLIDRYFGAASTTPAAVFGTLLANANKAHLPKLRKTRPSVYNALQRRLEEIISQPEPMTHFKKTLTLSEQGLFALGYYHQRAQDRAAAMEARGKVDAGDATDADQTVADLPRDEPTELELTGNKPRKFYFDE